MKVLIGKKLGMLQHFAEDGTAHGVTAVEVWPTTVTRLRTTEKDGYQAMQVTAGEAKRGKAVAGQTGGKGHTVLAEFPLASDEVSVGTLLGLDQFEAGEKVTVIAISKGKGFQGTVKRHNFSRGPKTHGSRNYRQPGSVGGTDAARVFPGQKMPGRMGNRQVTTKNLKVSAIHASDNVVLLQGAIPGPPGRVVTLRAS